MMPIKRLLLGSRPKRTLRRSKHSKGRSNPLFIMYDAHDVFGSAEAYTLTEEQMMIPTK